MSNEYPSPEEMNRIMQGARQMRAQEIARQFNALRQWLRSVFTTAPRQVAER